MFKNKYLLLSHKKTSVAATSLSQKKHLLLSLRFRAKTPVATRPFSEAQPQWKLPPRVTEELYFNTTP
ncbi:hypothetical protein [Lysinibacillus sphaericus]|uniref:hypothetical protein n=1 Tax=Lysinibacillus sphaericus TaxID=1421 RepID=UPI001CBBF11D|nr:hypothetical protein [Lysinibacillus sphaericus]